MLGLGAASSVVASVGEFSNPLNRWNKSSSVGNLPTEGMTYRTISTAGDKISLLGYGCMRWPMIKDASGKDVIDQETVNQLVDYAIEHGVNYFDTSPHYGRGQSERASGNALKRHPRNSFFLTTKMSTFLDANGNSREVAIAGYRKSFEECQVDYFDYYLIHGVGIGGMDVLHSRLLDIGMLDFLQAEKKKGKIRNLGFSFHGDVAVFDYLMKMQDEGRIRWDAVQIQMNYVDWKHASGWNVNAEYLYGELAKRNIPVIIMEPLLGGRLSNMAVPLMNKLKTQRPNDSVPSWSFRFDASHANVMTILSGMTNIEHLQDNVRTFSPLIPLAEADYKMLEEVAELYVKYPLVPCTACEYCMPCPYGVNIPGVFAQYNKNLNEDTLPVDRQDSRYNEKRDIFLNGYDRSLTASSQADQCIDCKHCIPLCPQRINIPSEMSRITGYVDSLRENTI